MRNLIKYLSLGVGILILSLCLGASAHAVVFPSKGVINPVAEVVYVPDNFSASGPGIRIYYKVGSAKKYWQEEKTYYIKLPSECYGLAVWQTGTYGQPGSYGKLLISINDGTNSKVRYYKLDDQGFPGTTYKDVKISEIGSSPVGIVITSTDSNSPSGDRAYLADAGNGRVYYLNYYPSTDEWKKAGYFETDYNIYGIAVTPAKNTYSFNIDPFTGKVYHALTSSTYKIFVSTKVSPGKVQIFDYLWTKGSTQETFAASGEVTGLQYPTFMKVDSKGEKLYVAVNGASGGDVKVYDINDSTPVLSNAQTISSPVTGAYGWTDFAIDFTGKYLFFSQKDNIGQTFNTNIYKVDLPVTGTPKVTGVTTLQNIEIDGMIASPTYPVLAGSHSLDGSLTEIDATGGNNFPDIPKNLKQYKKDGTTELKSGDTTDEDQIIVKFDVSDPDGGKLYPVVRYHMSDPYTGLFPATWTEVTAEAVESGKTVTMTLPKSGSFSDGDYEWEATVIDVGGLKPETVSGTYWAWYNDDMGVIDFTVKVVTVDTTSPEAITDLSAAPGTNQGDVDITWIAPGDDGNKGTVSGYTVRYITSTTPLTSTFTESNFDTTGTKYDTSGWTSLAAGGSKEKRTLKNIPYSTGTPTYIYIAMKSYDEVPNTSLISNIAVTFVKDSIPAPTITSVYPGKAPENTTQTLAVEGTGFWTTTSKPLTVELIKTGSSTITGTSVSLEGTTKITCSINLTGATIGKYDVKVTNPDGQNATSTEAFEVISSGSDTTAPALITDFTALAGDQEVSLSWTNPSDTDLAEILVLRKTGTYPTSHSDSSATKVYPTTTTVPKPGASETYTDTGLTNGTTYYYAVFSKDTSGNWNDTVTDGSNADNATPSKTAGGSKKFSISYLSETQAENWISVPYNSPQVSGSSISTIGKLMDSLVVFTPQNGDIMTLSWYNNKTQTVTSIMRDYNGTSWNSWDPTTENQSVSTGEMYVLTISNSSGRSTFTNTWEVSGSIPAAGTVTFDFSYQSETQAENWLSTPNSTALTTKGSIMTSLAGKFTPEKGDIMTMSWYDNATQTVTSIMRDYDGSTWNSWDPTTETKATTLGDPYKVTLSNSSGRSTFTVTWP